MKPSDLYQQRKSELQLQDDPVQNQVVARYDQLQSDLLTEYEQLNSKRGLFNFNKARRQDINGLYIWGGVGRGKTMLMDIFYDTLEQEQKLRMHFHRFMVMVHNELRKQGEVEEPLTQVARKIAQETRVLCLDEFHVNDIGDAMILGILWQELFKRRVLLITTSNRPPDDLYKDGLQRARFIPAIEAIKQFCDVIELDNQTDYRLLTLQKSDTFITPADDRAETLIQECYKALTSGEPCDDCTISINDRLIRHRGQAEGAIWFDFEELCETHRSHEDYLEIATEYHSVFLSNIPQMDNDKNDAARRFLNLLDVLYDHRVKLIASADAGIDTLYTGKRLKFEFDRASSRLFEMQSYEYLALSHQP